MKEVCKAVCKANNITDDKPDFTKLAKLSKKDLNKLMLYIFLFKIEKERQEKMSMRELMRLDEADTLMQCFSETGDVAVDGNTKNIQRSFDYLISKLLNNKSKVIRNKPGNWQDRKAYWYRL